MQRSPYDAALVEERLMEASRTLMALPGSGGPAQFRSSMPEYVREAIEGYGWTGAQTRPGPPDMGAIARMDQAFGWIRLIPADRVVFRRIVAARSLCLPLQDRPLMSWRRIGEKVGSSHVAARGWHRQAIGMIVVALERPGFCAAAGGTVGGGRRDIDLALRRVTARASRRGRVGEMA